MESTSPDKKNGCMKVEDPYFGKRKPSIMLKRIQRKISLLESQKELTQSNQERASSALPSKTRKDVTSLRETKTEELHRSIKDSTTDSMAQQQRASTAPGRLSTSSLNADPWPTKEEFINLLFRMI